VQLATGRGPAGASRLPGDVTPLSDFATLVQISRLYYELGETQGRIAEILGIPRPQVSRLLKQARDEGIVEIRIVDRTHDDSPAADELRRRFSLQAVHLAPSVAGPEDLVRRVVARLAAQVFRSAVRDGMVVGVGEGSTASAIADALAEGVSAPVAATVIPLCGGYWFAGASHEPFRRIGGALGASVRGLLAPGLVDDALTKRSLYAHAGVQVILHLWERLDIALFGIGGRVWGDASFGPEIVREIEDGGAVGEVLIAPYDLDGQFLGRGLRERTIAFDARELHTVPVTIGVAGGPSKVGPILGALKAGVVKILVTDVVTAEAVVDLDDRLRSESRTQPSHATGNRA
jgi:deoxyribonucleoside regulator